jgi:TRAP-type C4-dicarboxylate transport system permease small subunit
MTFDPYDDRPSVIAGRQYRLRQRRKLARRIWQVLVLGVVSAIAAFALGSNLDTTHFHDNANGFMWRFPLSLLFGSLAVGCLIWLLYTLINLIRPKDDG